MTISLGVRLLTIFFCAAGIYCIVVGLRFDYYGRLGPGPGFFPIWIGALLALLSAAQFVKTFLGEGAAPRLRGHARAQAESAGATDEGSQPFFADRSGARRVGMLAAAATIATILMGYLGFRLTIFVFCLVTPSTISRQHPLVTVVVALLCSFGVAYVFENWLGVRLPRAVLGPLRGTGL